MGESLKRDGQELKSLRNKALDVEEAFQNGIEALQAQLITLRNELDRIEDEVVIWVREKLMYQFMMGRAASWELKKKIDLYLEWLGSMKDLRRRRHDQSDYGVLFECWSATRRRFHLHCIIHSV